MLILQERDGETVELVNIPRINISSISAHTDELAPYRELAHLCRLSHLTFHPVSISGWADAGCRESHSQYLSQAVPVETTNLSYGKILHMTNVKKICNVEK